MFSLGVSHTSLESSANSKASSWTFNHESTWGLSAPFYEGIRSFRGEENQQRPLRRKGVRRNRWCHMYRREQTPSLNGKQMREGTAHGQQQPAKMLQSPGRRWKGSGHRTSRGWKRSWTLQDLWVRPIRVWLCKDWEGKVFFSFLLGYWGGGGHLCRENNSVFSLRVKAGLLETGSDYTYREQDGEWGGLCGGGVVGETLTLNRLGKELNRTGEAL